MKFIAIISLSVFTFALICGCVEETNLSKYDHYSVPLEKLTTIDKVDIPVAEDQSFDQEPNLVPIKPGKVNDLTIEECRVLALQNNLTLKVDSFQPAIDREKLLASHAAFEPLFVSSMSFAKSDDPLGQYEQNTSARFGISQPLITGGSVSLSLPLGEYKRKSSGIYYNEITQEYEMFSSDSRLYSSAFNFSVSQDLLRGAGVNNQTHSIRLASYSLKQSLRSSKQSAMTVLKEVDKAYWNLYYSQEALKVSKIEYDLARLQFEQAQRMFNLNQVAQIEVLRAESTMASKKLAIISAENALRDSQRNLKLVLNAAGLEVESASIVNAVTEPNPVKYIIDTNSLLEYAMDHRLELLDYELRLASQESTLEFQKNSLLPKLALSYTYYGNAGGTGYYDAFSNLGEHQYNDNTIGLTLQMPLGNRVAKSNYRSAMLWMEEINTNKELQEITIKNEVLQAADNLSSGWDAILVAQSGVDIALRTLEAEQRQYELGMQNSTELEKAQADYARALRDRLNSLVKYQISQIDLCYSVGGLNEAARLDFEQ